MEEKCSTLKRLHFGFVQKKMVPNVMKRTTAMYQHVVIAKNRNSRYMIIHCSKQMWDLPTAVYISKGNHQTIGKFHILCVLLGLGLDLEEKCSTLKRLHFGFVQKKMVPNVMKRTTAMYQHVVIAQNRNSRYMIIHCSKQMWDLLTAAWISKGNHQTIGKLDILCVLLGLALDLEEICSNLKAFTCWFFTKEDGAQRDEKDNCYVPTCSYCQKSKFQIHDYTLQ